MIKVRSDDFLIIMFVFNEWSVLKCDSVSETDEISTAKMSFYPAQVSSTEPFFIRGTEEGGGGIQS